MLDYISLKCADGRAFVSRESMNCDPASAVLDLPLHVRDVAYSSAWRMLYRSSARVEDKARTLDRATVERELRAQWQLYLSSEALEIARSEEAQ